MHDPFYLTQEEAGTQSVGHTGSKKQNKDLGPTGVLSFFKAVSSQVESYIWSFSVSCPPPPVSNSNNQESWLLGSFLLTSQDYFYLELLLHFH